MNDREREENKIKHEKVKKYLKIIGPILIGVGLIFAIIGFVDFFGSINSWGQPTKFWCLFLGIPLIGVGLMITLIAYQREVSRYMKNESAPIINETAEDIKPAVKTFASAVKSAKLDGCTCRECGAENEPDSNFCSECGAKLKIICPSCGEELNADSKFCDKCGYKL